VKIQLIIENHILDPSADLIGENIRTKAPSAELGPDQLDTDSLPPYSILDNILKEIIEDKDNIIIVGPLPGDTNKEIVFPVLSPDPSTNKEYHYGKYSLHIGGNRGRGQVYPTGDKSNNVVFTSSTAGTINSIETIEDGSYQVNIENDNGEITTEAVPVGPQLIVKAQDKINVGDPLTNDPNVGGFGQLDAEVVLQSPYRVIGLIAFFIGVGLTQILLVLKKKQVEKVQAAEGI